jgi:hypothetical protein
VTGGARVVVIASADPGLAAGIRSLRARTA